MPTTIEGAGSAAGLRFGIIRSRFNEEVTKRLLEGALEALRKAGARDDTITVVLVPGAFEIPLVAARMARTRRYDALICLGAVIRGETPHFEYISAEVSRGIARVAYDSGVPVIFGVLTTDTEEQADARSGKKREGARPMGKEPVLAGEGRAGATAPEATGKGPVSAGPGRPGAMGGCENVSNKGYEAGVTAIEMANLMKRLGSPSRSPRGAGASAQRRTHRKRAR
jgi:6,7-dimethyl-8-ribityllumazine synthase